MATKQLLKIFTSGPRPFPILSKQWAFCWPNVRCCATASKNSVFKKIDGSVDATSAHFRSNHEQSTEVISKFKQVLSMATSGGGAKAIDRHINRNKKLLVEDRLRLLFDDYDNVLEVAPLAGMGMKYGDIPRAGILVAVGKIHGVYCLVIANDATVKAGTIYPISVKKQLRCQEFAKRNHIPCIFVVDSGGAFLPLQAEIFLPGGGTFYNEAILNSKDIRQLAIVCGSCTAGAAYVPTMAQEAIIVKRIGTIFLGGPPLVQAALGEVVSPDELGGAMLHSSVSGCTDYYADTEDEAFEMGRDSVAAFNIEPVSEPEHYDEPQYDADELLGIIPATNQHEMDIYKVIARIIDGSRFHEFKAKYGTTVVTGFARIKGHLVGVAGNQGVMTEAAALKCAHFVQMCSQRNIPLIFLQNASPDNTVTTSTDSAFLEGCAIRAQAKLMGAVACSSVPKITVVVGNSYGPTNYMMGGRSFEPELLFSWPNSKTAAMEPNQLVSQLSQSSESASLSDDEMKELAKRINSEAELKTSALYSSGNLWDDGIILPQDTRNVLGKALSILSQHKTMKQDVYNVMRM